MARLVIMIDVKGIDPTIMDPQVLAEDIVMDGPEYSDGVRFTIADNAEWIAENDDPLAWRRSMRKLSDKLFPDD